MKRHRLKTYLKLGILLFGIVLLVIACDKDIDELQEPQTQSRTITKKLLSTEQVKQNKKIGGILENFQNRESNNLYKSRAYDTINGFSVDASEAIYLEVGDYHSYTFTVYGNPDEDILENLVLSLNKQNSYDAYLWKYDKSTNETIDETTPIEITKLENFDEEPVMTTEGYPCQNGWRIEIDYVDINGNIHDNNDDDCVGCYAIGYWVQCNNTGGSTGGNDNGDSDDNSSGDNGGGNDDTGSNGDGNNGNDDEPWDGDIGEDSPDGGGSSSGGDGSALGNDIKDDTVITTPNEKCKGGKIKVNGICQCPEGKIEDEVGNCIHENIPNNDCSQLGVLSDVPLIKTRLNQLRQSSSNFEKGLKVSKNSDNEYVPSPIIENNTGSNHINIPVHGFISAIAHTHPNYVFYKMYSAPDILKMAQMANRVQSQNGSPVQLTEITHILIFNIDGTDFTFALRFDDLESVQKLQDIVNNPKAKERFKEKLLNLYESDTSGPPAYLPDTSIGQQQRHMFNLFNKYNLNMSLYEANFNANGTINNWQRINKDSLDKENCN